MKSLGFSHSSAELSGFATAMALGITLVLPGLAGLALITREIGDRFHYRGDFS